MTQSQYEETVKRLQEFDRWRWAKRARFVELGFREEMIIKMFEPEESFYDQIKAEVAAYEKEKKDGRDTL